METFKYKGKREKSNKIYIIGNGISRKGINLTELNAPTIGCNIIYKEFIPTKVASICEKIIEQIILENPEILKHLIVPEIGIRKLSPENIKVLKDNNCLISNIKRRYFTTGNFAIEYGILKYKPKELHLIGFDSDSSNIFYGYKYYKIIRKDIPAKNKWRVCRNQLRYILGRYGYIKK